MTQKADERTPDEQIQDAITAITDDVLAAKLPACPRYLNLSGTSVTDKGMAILVARATELRVLSLVGCAGISVEGFRQVAKLPKLETLRVSGAQLTVEVATALMACPALRRIEVSGKASAGRALTDLKDVLRRRRPS